MKTWSTKSIAHRRFLFEVMEPSEMSDEDLIEDFGNFIVFTCLTDEKIIEKFREEIRRRFLNDWVKKAELRK